MLYYAIRLFLLYKSANLTKIPRPLVSTGLHDLKQTYVIIEVIWQDANSTLILLNLLNQSALVFFSTAVNIWLEYYIKIHLFLHLDVSFFVYV